MMSVKYEYMEICKLLIENGALPSINTPNNVNIIFKCLIKSKHMLK
jgi:hypothetical protein